MVAICASEMEEARRRRLEELFEDEPFLSPTMKARSLHEREIPASLASMEEPWLDRPVTPVNAGFGQSEDKVVRLGLVVNLKQDAEGLRAELQQSDSPDVMTAAEAARFMRIGQATLRRWVKDLGLPCARVGRARRFRKAAVLRWLKAREAAA